MSVAVTQCPHCRAKFRVRDEHVRAHSGLVRCGACRGIFDARLNLVEGRLVEFEEDADTFGSPNTIMQGVPAVAHAPTVDDGNATPSASTQTAAASSGERERSYTNASAATDSASKGRANDVDRSDYDWRAPTRPLSRIQKIGYAFVALIATIALVAQTAYWFRDELASRYSQLAKPLALVCERIGCKVSPPKKSEALGFVGSELAADAAHRGLHIFSATLRNTGSYSVAFPSLILTLEGVGGAPIARKVFTPEQYAPANASLQRGIDAGADLEIKLYLDVSPTVPVGFKADHAYL
jgi:predicted Zn finger-like uncharacterized protein